MVQHMGNTASSFGSIIGGDSQVEPQELSQNIEKNMSRYSDSNKLQNHKYIESYKSLQAHRAMIKKCPMHGEQSDYSDYKETMALMAA